MTVEELVAQRYQKYRNLGTFSLIPDPDERKAKINEAGEKKGATKSSARVDTKPSLLIKHLGEEIVTGLYSRYRGLAPVNCPSTPPVPPTVLKVTPPEGWMNAKKVGGILQY